jgi:hypothetical protein
MSMSLHLNHLKVTPRSKARANTLLLTHIEPTTSKQALQSSEWVKAMQEEYNALMKNNTWNLVDPPDHKRPIGCIWVFIIKENPDGTINKYKARLVHRGFHKKTGSDFIDFFSCCEASHCQNCAYYCCIQQMPYSAN